jgi:hypothetical protein
LPFGRAIMSRNSRQGARRPATKLAHLRKKLQKQKVQGRAVKRK